MGTPFTDIYGYMLTIVEDYELKDLANIDEEEFYNFLKGIVIIGIPVLIIMLQNDTGSALVFGSFIFIFFGVGGFPLLAITSFSVGVEIFCKKLE